MRNILIKIGLMNFIKLGFLIAILVSTVGCGKMDALDDVQEIPTPTPAPIEVIEPTPTPAPEVDDGDSEDNPGYGDDSEAPGDSDNSNDGSNDNDGGSNEGDSDGENNDNDPGIDQGGGSSGDGGQAGDEEGGNTGPSAVEIEINPGQWSYQVHIRLTNTSSSDSNDWVFGADVGNLANLDYSCWENGGSINFVKNGRSFQILPSTDPWWTTFRAGITRTITCQINTNGTGPQELENTYFDLIHTPPTNNDGGAGGSDPSTGDQTQLPLNNEYRIVAKKHYSPSRWENGNVTVSNVSAKIPSRVSIKIEDGVALGNAGNHWLWINFTRVQGNIKCKYRGGSSQSKPNGETQVNLGLHYNFDKCEDSSGERVNVLPGDYLEMFSGDQIEVSVSNGDSRQSTVVEAVIEVVSHD